jgi:dihydroneopterin aldolase
MKIVQSSISLRALRFYAYHGVLPQERKVGGEYEVTVKADVDFSQAVASDCVEDTVNYAAMYESVRQEMAVPSHLLEHVAGRIARRLLNDFPAIETLSVEVVKLNPPMGADGKGAGVEITMKNETIHEI